MRGVVDIAICFNASARGEDPLSDNPLCLLLKRFLMSFLLFPGVVPDDAENDGKRFRLNEASAVVFGKFSSMWLKS